MIIIENECVGCSPEMGCIGNACPYKNVPRLYCDNCGTENVLYWWNGQQFCIDCIEERLERVDIDDYE